MSHNVILHVITNFSDPNGAEAMLARLLRVSSAERVIVAPLMEASAVDRALADNPNVIYEPQHVRSTFDVISATIRLARLIRRERPSVVLCWLYHAMVVGLLAGRLARLGTPVFWNIRQSLDDPDAFSRNSRIALRVSRDLSRLPNGAIFNSLRALELHRQYGFRIENAVMIPNGFDLPDQIVTRSKKPAVIGIAGRLHPQKDYPNFFRAAALVASSRPEVRFVAAGDGLLESNPQIMSMISDAGLPIGRIELRGRVERMSEFYRNIDIFVLSSRTEGFPNVVAEAMSYAIPVVTTDVGDAAAIVGDTGIAVPAKDSARLAAAMGQMLDLSADAYCTQALAARRRVEEKYSLMSIDSQYKTFLGLK